MNRENEAEDWGDEMNRRVEAATTRAEKLAVCKDYMSEDMAHDALGLYLGEHDGDVIDLSKAGPEPE